MPLTWIDTLKEHHFYFFSFSSLFIKTKASKSWNPTLCEVLMRERVGEWVFVWGYDNWLFFHYQTDNTDLNHEILFFRETLKTSAEAVGVFKTIIWCLEALIWFLEKLYDIIALSILICVFSLVDKKNRIYYSKALNKQNTFAIWHLQVRKTFPI